MTFASILLMVVSGTYLAFKWVQLRARLRELHPIALTTVLLFSTVVLLIFEVISQLRPSPNFYPVTISASMFGVFGTISLALLPARTAELTQKLDRAEKFTLLFGAALFVGELIIVIARWNWAMDGRVVYRGEAFFVPSAIGLIVALAMIVRCLIVAVMKVKNLSFGSAFETACKSLFFPKVAAEREVLVAKSFLLLLFFPLGFVLAAALQAAGIIGWSALYITSSVTVFGLILSLILILINFTPYFFSFKIRIIGAALVCVFFIVGAFTWVIAGAVKSNYGAENWVKAPSALVFAPVDSLAYQMDRVAFEVASVEGRAFNKFGESLQLPFEFEFFGQTYDAIYINEKGFVSFERAVNYNDLNFGFGSAPSIFAFSRDLQFSPEQGGVFVSSTSNRFIVAWRGLRDNLMAQAHYDFRMELAPSGRIEIFFETVPRTFMAEEVSTGILSDLTGIFGGANMDARLLSAVPRELPLIAATMEPLIINWDLDYRAYLNQYYQPILLVILLGAAFVLLALPLFFTSTLEKPLIRLMNAAREVARGNLDVRVKSAHADEIGYLTDAFNDMTQAQHDLVEGLETRVRERTREAVGFAAENARLEERSQMHRELHDAVSQTLFSANLMAEGLPEVARKNPEKAGQHAEKLRQLNQTALDEMRNLITQFGTTGREQETFGALLDDMATELRALEDMAVELVVENDARLPGEVQHTFFRIAQESINNVVKHAQASKIDIYFDGSAQQALLSVADDGKGFAVGGKSADSYGINIMKERARDIDASLEVETQKGEGVKISLIWFADEENEID